jgi:hypothetical protein
MPAENSRIAQGALKKMRRQAGSGEASDTRPALSPIRRGPAVQPPALQFFWHFPRSCSWLSRPRRPAAQRHVVWCNTVRCNAGTGSFPPNEGQTEHPPIYTAQSPGRSPGVQQCFPDRTATFPGGMDARPFAPPHRQWAGPWFLGTAVLGFPRRGCRLRYCLEVVAARAHADRGGTSSSSLSRGARGSR